MTRLQSGAIAASRSVLGPSRLLLLLLIALLLGGGSLGGSGVAAQEESEIEGPALTGTLRDRAGDPVAGVVITVLVDEEVIGEAASDGEGAWVIEVPSAGTYTVRLEVDSLPAGTPLSRPDRNPQEVEVGDDQVRSVSFPLGERGVGRSNFDKVIDLGVQGIKLGTIIAMAAVGLSLIFGVTGLVNFAHGELVTFGAVVAFLFNASPAGPRWHLAIAAPIAIVAGGLFGATLEKGFFRPLRRRGTGLVALIVVTIGLSLLVRHVTLLVYGGRPRPFADYAVQRAVTFGPIGIAPKDIFITVAGLAVLVLVGLLLRGTRVGTGMRAVRDNSDLAASSGVNVERVILVTWVSGAALAALGGVFFGMTETVAWDMGFRLLLIMFAAVILGGLGTAYGAMAGGLVIGVVSEVSTVWFPVDFKLVFVFLALVLTLLVRPQGILGVRERIG